MQFTTTIHQSAKCYCNLLLTELQLHQHRTCDSFFIFLCATPFHFKQMGEMHTPVWDTSVMPWSGWCILKCTCLHTAVNFDFAVNFAPLIGWLFVHKIYMYVLRSFQIWLHMLACDYANIEVLYEEGAFWTELIRFWKVILSTCLYILLTLTMNWA